MLPNRSVGLLNCRVSRGYVERRTDGRDDHVDHEQRHERIHHRLVDRIAHRLGAAAGDGQAAIARHQAGDQPEQRRLHTGDDHLGHPGQQRDASGERARIHILNEHGKHVAAEDSDDDDQAVEQ